MPTLMPAARTRRRLDIPPGDRLPRRRVDEVGGEKWKCGLGCPCFERAAWIVRGHLWRGRRAHRAKVELVVTDRGSGVAERVIGGNNRRAFGQVRFERALEHVTGVDRQHRATVAGAHVTQLLQVTAKKREAPAAFSFQQTAVKVIGSDDRNRDQAWRSGRRWLRAWSAV